MKTSTPTPLLLTSLATLSFFISGFTISVSDVYICKGNYSKKYHYAKNCRGLSNCSTDIYAVTLSDAKQIGRTLCGWED
ncbi:hypothetical protein BXY75_0985 [Ulvibacter antarcticus]|uniref:Uncharacterized protein n=1 Tax=Ulvibacter antarcticus TaxID=442714 RepID=A0A3L9Z7X6_9FLAO|nr:hypothetical protein BXY75_0985 [Ulvibacter antarcticus]